MSGPVVIMLAPQFIDPAITVRGEGSALPSAAEAVFTVIASLRGEH